MGARILFLGTGGDSIVIGKQYRSSGGIIFNYGEEQFHIDPGPGSLVMAKMTGVNLRENTAIFVSGNDIFRANDINAVVSAMTHDGLDKRGVLVCPMAVAHQNNKDEDPFLNSRYKKHLEKIIAVDNTKRLGINDIEIEIIKLKEGCGFKFITPKFNLAYIPNTILTRDLLDLENIDVLILGIKNPGEVEKNSMNSRNAEKLVKALRPQLCIATGFGIKMLQADPLYEVRQMQKNTGVQIIGAKDGMNINPTSFSATVRQKNLKGFQN